MERNKDSGVIWACGFFLIKKNGIIFVHLMMYKLMGKEKCFIKSTLKLIVKFVMKTEISEHSDEGSHLV